MTAPYCRRSGSKERKYCVPFGYAQIETEDEPTKTHWPYFWMILTVDGSLGEATAVLAPLTWIKSLG